MTDKEALFAYRLQQAEETLSDAETMLVERVSPRSIINRAYYSMFYGLLALFIRTDVTLRTSKHAGVISVFDKEFVQTGKIEKDFSRTMHRMFDTRQESDYKELVHYSYEDAGECVKLAGAFLRRVKAFLRIEPDR